MNDHERLTEQLRGKVVEMVETYPYGPTRITFTDGAVAVFDASGTPPTVHPKIYPSGESPKLWAKVFRS